MTTNRMWHKGSKTAAGLVLAAAILFFTTGVRPVQADAIWDMELKAKAAEQAGDPAAAAPYWEGLRTYSESVGNWDNAALYAKSLGKYYDSIGSNGQAIRYYELENGYWLKGGRDWGAADMQRAEEIRITIELYVSASGPVEAKRLAAPKSGGLAKFEPETGVYLGMYSEQDPQMGNNFSRSESIYGKKHALYLAYTPYGTKFPMRYADNARQAGAGLQFGFEPTGGLDRVADDAYLRQWARDAKKAGVPIFLRYASEMNGAWVNWHGDPQKYIDKFRIVARVMKEEAPNVAMVWSPGDVPRNTMAEYYPGDDYVDWVGVSMYTEPEGNGDPSDPQPGLSPVERLEELNRLYGDRKPLMISETAVSHTTHKDGKNHTEYALMNLERLYGIMPKKYPRLKAITYFNVDLKKDSQNDYLLRDNPAMMQLYKDKIAEPNFLIKIETGAKPPVPEAYAKIDGTVFLDGPAQLAAFVKIPDVYIGKVEFVLNGIVIASQTKAPYGISIDPANLRTDSTLEVRVYNANGLQAGAKTFRLSPGVTVELDGKKLDFEQPPVIVAGNTLVPMRAIFEAMGAAVNWDASLMQATGVNGGTTVTLRIGSTLVSRNNVFSSLEQPAQLINGYTLAPARFIGEAFGATVSWDGTHRIVKIATNPQ